MDGDEEDINKLYDGFEHCKLAMEKRKQVVERLLKKLQLTYSGENGVFIPSSKFIGIGSSYENTVVSPKVDFDIAMVLPYPFTMENFECVNVEAPGLYMLKCKSGPPNLLYFLNINQCLLIELLRDAIFTELSAALRNVIFEGYEVQYTTLSSSFCVKLKRSHDYIKIDIVPQIKARVNDIPGWKGKNLPRSIQDYIKNNDTHILFNLSCPPNFKYANFKSLVVQPSFNLLEKEAMLNSDTLRYSVSIAKTVYKHYRWANKGLRSFHIKRIALHLYSTIERSRSSWFGFVIIMEELITMLEDGKIDGCFIDGQNIICQDKRRCRELAKEVEVYRVITPGSVVDFLDPSSKKKSSSTPTTIVPPSVPDKAREYELTEEAEVSRDIDPYAYLEFLDSSYIENKCNAIPTNSVPPPPQGEGRCQKLIKEVEGYKREPSARIENRKRSSSTIAVPSPTERRNLNIPTFRKDAAFSWFELLEERFSLHGIISDEVKFNSVLAALPQEIVKQISPTIIIQSTFSSLKRSVIDLCGENKAENLDEIVSTLSIKDEPSRNRRLTEENDQVDEDVDPCRYIDSIQSLKLSYHDVQETPQQSHSSTKTVTYKSTSFQDRPFEHLNELRHTQANVEWVDDTIPRRYIGTVLSSKLPYRDSHRELRQSEPYTKTDCKTTSFRDEPFTHFSDLQRTKENVEGGKDAVPRRYNVFPSSELSYLDSYRRPPQSQPNTKTDEPFTYLKEKQNTKESDKGDEVIIGNDKALEDIVRRIYFPVPTSTSDPQPNKRTTFSSDISSMVSSFRRFFKDLF